MHQGGVAIPPIIWVCIVLLTLAFAALAVVSIRAMKSFQRASSEMEKTSATVKQLTREVQAITRTVRGMTEELGQLMPRVRGVGRRLGGVRQRAAHLTNGSLEDVRETLRRAASTMRAARDLTSLVFRKVAQPSSPIRSNGG